MSYFAEVAADDGAVGGTARSLARRAAAGCRVPAGFVVTDRLFRTLAAGAFRVISAGGATTLRSVTLQGRLDLPNDADVTVTGGLAVTGTFNIQGANYATDMYCEGPVTLSGGAAAALIFL